MKNKTLLVADEPDATISIELEVDEHDQKLISFDALETAQRLVAIALLEGRMNSRDAGARTRVLSALAARLRDADAHAK